MRRTIPLLLMMLMPLGALAETFRCGQWVISTDMPVAELAGKCGEPTSREIRTEDIYARNQYGLRVKTGDTTTTEIWVYERGSRAAALVVTITDGAIRKIERRK